MFRRLTYLFQNLFQGRRRLEDVPGDVQVFQTWGRPDIYEGPNYIIRLVARLKPGVSMVDAQADLNRVAEEIRGESPELARDNLRFVVVGQSPAQGVQ